MGFIDDCSCAACVAAFGLNNSMIQASAVCRVHAGELSIEFDRPSDDLVSVTFCMAISDFEEASRVMKIISGEIDLQ